MTLIHKWHIEMALKGLSLRERVQHETEVLRTALDQFARKMRVACPGIIQSFDSSKQTVSVQLAIMEELSKNGERTSVKIPILEDIPIVVPRGGGFSITLPIAVGDECLVVFGDMCIDSWWQSGGDNNIQMDRRRHDLSDGFAILGCWNQKKVISNYSVNSIQIRNDSGADYVEVKDGNINVVSSSEVNITASGEVNITASSTVNIDATTINLGT